MIKPLRKLHFITWHLFALVLPFLFVLAIALRPQTVNTMSVAGDGLRAEVTSLTDSTSLLIIDVLKPVDVPSCVVYQVVDGKEVLLGKLNHQGQFSFSITRKGEKVAVRLYDIIARKTIKELSIPY